MELRVTIHPHLLKRIKHFIPKICIATNIIDVLLVYNGNFRKRDDQCRFTFSFISSSLYLYFYFSSHHITSFITSITFLFLSSFHSYTLKRESVLLFPSRTKPGNPGIQGKNRKTRCRENIIDEKPINVKHTQNKNINIRWWEKKNSIREKSRATTYILLLKCYSGAMTNQGACSYFDLEREKKKIGERLSGNEWGFELK